jgi:hypothetical protein
MILDASLADCQSTDKCTQSLLRREKRETIRTKAYRPCRFAASIGRPRIADGDQSGNQNSLRYLEAVTTYYCGPTVFVGFTPKADMSDATGDVCFGPIADMADLLD